MTDAFSKNQGIVYVAFGERYCEEARRSLTSLRKVSSVSTAVVTDQPWSQGAIPDHFVIREPVRSFRAKPLCIYNSSPFDNTLFLDTDTILGSDPTPAFGLLDHYDIGVNFGGARLKNEDSLAFHSQCNSGVILFKRNDAVAMAMRDWLALYDDAASRLGASDQRGVGDQRYLAMAIARSPARPVHLGNFLNFALFDTLATCCPPVVYHGRAPWIEQLVREVNNNWDPKTDWWARVWMPNIAGFLPRGVRRSDPLLALALFLRRLYNEVKRRSGHSW